ncbi:MAG TPA: hypothetical protein VK427_02110 [Kofleriaceae bacterium]|nr:hypothetical protein [Kofleriaceae bacterium]
MVVRTLACIVVAGMHAACSSSPSLPDAIDIDASIGGLTIELVALGGVPQMAAPTVEILSVTIGMKSLRAIGDSAPGDLSTTRLDRELVWSETRTPIPQLFPHAPPGLYSRVEIRIADWPAASAAIGVTGRAVRAGTLVPFEIKGESIDVPIDVVVNTQLQPREFVISTIQVDVAALVRDIDWNTVPLTGDGKIVIGDGDPALAGVVSRLPMMFAQR